MKCHTHPDREARGVCVDCGHLICSGCALEIRGKLYCKQCVSETLVSHKQTLIAEPPVQPQVQHIPRNPWPPMAAAPTILLGFPSLCILIANYWRMKKYKESMYLAASTLLVLVLDFILFPEWWWILALHLGLGVFLIWVQQGFAEEWRRQNEEKQLDSPWQSVLAGLTGIVLLAAYVLVAASYL